MSENQTSVNTRLVEPLVLWVINFSCRSLFDGNSGQHSRISAKPTIDKNGKDNSRPRPKLDCPDCSAERVQSRIVTGRLLSDTGNPLFGVSRISLRRGENQPTPRDGGDAVRPGLSFSQNADMSRKESNNKNNRQLFLVGSM